MLVTPEADDVVDVGNFLVMESMMRLYLSNIFRDELFFVSQQLEDYCCCCVLLKLRNWMEVVEDDCNEEEFVENLVCEWEYLTRDIVVELQMLCLLMEAVVVAEMFSYE